MFGTVPADSRKSNASTSAVMVSGNITSSKATSTLQNWSVPGYSFQSVVGYVPLNLFGTPAIAPDYAFFMNMPDKINETNILVTDANLLLLPIGAKICGIYLTNNGDELIADTAPYTITISAIDIVSPATNPQILITAPITDINTFGGIAKGITGSPLDVNLPITGAAYQLAVSENALLTASYGLGIQVSSLDLLTGSLGVIVSYIVPGPSFGTVIQSI
jgi:hypothetical protein